MDLYKGFQNTLKSWESEKRARPKRRKDRLDDLKPAWDIGTGSSEKFRIGWDRIFGSKTGDTVSQKGDSGS